MKKISLLFITVVLLLLSGCGGTNESSSISPSIETYEINTSTNNALMGPLKGAIVNVYSLDDFNNSIESTQTGTLGSFTLSLANLPDTQLLLVSISGGVDVDANDDGILDATPTINKGTIRALATASDLKNGRVNVSLLSEVVCKYVEHLFGNIDQADLEQAMNAVSAKLMKAQEQTVVSYRDINSFIPIHQEDKEKLEFNYDDLITEDSLATVIHEDSNDSVVEEHLESLFGTRLTLRSSSLLVKRQKYKVTLAPALNTDIVSDGSNLFVSHETNESLLVDFVPSDTNITFTAIPTDDVNITGWDGCDIVSNDKLQCTIVDLYADRYIVPNVEYKEKIFYSNVKDLSDFYVSINDHNYTVSLDLDTNETTRDYIEGIAVDDTIISRKGDNRFFQKVTAVHKIDDYNYLFETEDTSFLEVYEQGGIAVSRNLTHEDLEEDIDTINRSLARSNAILLPPKHPHDDEFTIVFLDTQTPLTRDFTIEGLEQGQEFTVPLFNNGTVNVSIKGSLSFKVAVDFDYNTHWGFLQNLKFVTTTTSKGQINLVASGGFTTEDIGRYGLKVSLLGTTPSGVANALTFNIPSGFLMLRANVKLFAGIEGSLSTEATIGVERSSISREGVVYYNDVLTRIKENNTDVHAIGNVPNVKASVGAFLAVEPGVEVLKVAKLGISGKTGLYYDMQTQYDATSEGKLSWKNIISPTFEYIWPIANLPYFSRQNEEIARMMPSYEYSILIDQWKYSETEEKPSDLYVNTPLISEVIYNDEQLDKVYSFVVENKGEQTLNWELETEGELAQLLDISQTSGSLDAGKTEYITVIMSFPIDDLAGRTLNSKLRFINKENEEDRIEQSIALIIKPRAIAPDMIHNVYLTGESIKYINFSLPEYDWGINDRYDDKGFKIFISDFNETSSECTNDYQLFDTIDANSEDLNFNWTKVRFDEKVRDFALEDGKRYCFAYAAYLMNESSIPSAPYIFQIPEYGSLISSIKDENNNPIAAHIRLTMADVTTSSDGEGNFIFNNLVPGTYRITVEAEGYIPVVIPEFEIHSGINTLERVLTSSTELEDIIGTAQGIIKDAQTGFGVDNVTIEIREGRDNVTGTLLTTIYSDDNGNYFIDTLKTGNYTFHIVKDGYITLNENIYIVGNEINIKDLAIAPILRAGQMSIKLSWGELPVDLDSHLAKYTDGTLDYHLYYGNSTVSDGDNLDVDDTTSYGPETITINELNTASVYSYYVYNYSEDDDLKNSSAKVEVNYGDTQTQSFYVPNESGRYWKVFDIINGEIIPCTSNCVQDVVFTDVSRSFHKEEELFKNLPVK